MASSSSARPISMRRYYLFHAIRADLLRRLGRPRDAERAYDEAIERCENAAEQEFLRRSRARAGVC